MTDSASHLCHHAIQEIQGAGDQQWQYISGLLGDINAFNAKKISEELDAALRKFFPALGQFLTETKKYDKTIRSLKDDNAELQEELKGANQQSVQKLLKEAQLRADNEVQGQKKCSL